MMSEVNRRMVLEKVREARSAAAAMELKYGPEPLYLRYIDAELREKYHRQWVKLHTAIENEDDVKAVDLAKGAVRACWAVERALLEMGVPWVYPEPMPAGTDGNRAELPTIGHKGSAWNDRGGLGDELPF